MALHDVPTTHTLSVETIATLSFDGADFSGNLALCTFKLGMWTSGVAYAAAGFGAVHHTARHDGTALLHHCSHWQH